MEYPVNPALNSQTGELAQAVKKHDIYENLAKQVQTEYRLAWDNQNSRKTEWEARLKLYNNQKREPDKVGDRTLFTIHQTVLASLYADRLSAEWTGKEEGDDEVAENLNALTKSDYVEMWKDELDYLWDWDSLFFGRGLILFHEFRREPEKNIFLPVPEVIDPLTFLRDPDAESVNGHPILKRTSARFFGREIKMTEMEIRNLEEIADYSDIDFRVIKLGSGIKSMWESASEARHLAQGRDYSRYKQTDEKLGANARYTITEWYTNFKLWREVKKLRVWLANDRTKVIAFQVLGDFDELWPVIDRPLYPTAHDWDGVSITDLTEDDQRARAVAMNLAIDTMKADLYPMYLYNQNMIPNRGDLDFDFNKFIPIDSPVGDNIITPLRKSTPNLSLLTFIYETLDAASMRATATPEQRQGVQPAVGRTLGELELISAGSGQRYSLAAKVFGWSEKRFWRQWYKSYKDNFPEKIDEKILRIEGAFGPKWRKLSKRDITANLDPDVKIESEAIVRTEQTRNRALLTQYLVLAFNDANTNRRYGLKKLGRLNELEKDEIDRLLPRTIDERRAEKENELLNENKPGMFMTEDDHNVHLEIHARAKDTPSTRAHIKVHEEALLAKKIKPDLFPEEPEEAAFQPPGTPQLSLPAITGGSAPTEEAKVGVERARPAVRETTGRELPRE